MKALNLEHLTQLCEERNLVAKDLAKAANITLRAAKGLLDGSIKRPTKATITRLAEALCVNDEYLLIDVEPPKHNAPAPELEPAAEGPIADDVPEPAPVAEEVTYTTPDFLCVRNRIKGDDQEMIIRIDVFTGMTRATETPKIWYNFQQGNRSGYAVELFDTFDEQKARWEYIMEFLKQRGTLG